MCCFLFFKQKTAYEMRMSDWSSDVCSSDLNFSLAASNATLRASIEEVNAAAGKRLPQVDANARVEREQPNLAAFGFESDTGNPEFNLYSVGGGVSYDLDLFGGKKRAVEQAAAKAEAQRRQTERSEEHTSELQSLMRISYAVFCLKKKNKKTE